MEIAYMGIMVRNNTFKEIPNAKGELKKIISLYERAAKKNKVKLCFFPVYNIDFERKKITGYILGKEGYYLKTISIPAAIYKRGFYNKKYEPLIDSLVNNDGITIFNKQIFNFGKYEEYQLISKNKALKAHLPITYRATVKTVKNMMNRFNCLLIKPNRSSLGRGIMKLEKIGEKWCLTYKRKIKNNKWKWTKIYFKQILPKVLVRRIKNRRYIVQERIALATFQGAPFDMRVSVQKNHLAKWEVSAIIAKVAGKNQFLTNIHQGGESFKLDYLLNNHPSLSFSKVKKSINEFCLKVANHFESQYDGLGDLGFDVTITEKGYIYFIEVNFVSAYSSLAFRNNELIYPEWNAVFSKPIEYGSYILHQKK